MHILVVSQYFWPENFRINDLTEDWLRRGHRVTILTGRPNYPSGILFEEFKQNPKEFSSYHDAPVMRVPMLLRSSGAIRLFLNYISFVIGACLFGPFKLRGVRPDVIFVFEPSPVTVGLPAVLLGRLKKVPVVFWALDLWPETLAAIGVIKSPKMLRLIGCLVRFIYDRCELVLGQSRSFIKSIARYCSDRSKIRYFPSWAEDIYGTEDVVPAAEVPAQENSFDVMFAGNIGHSQDMSAVLAAAELLRDDARIRWLIVGDGRKAGWLEQEIKNRNLGSRVLMLGRFPVERMPSFYAQADALLVSLRQDPVFSMTIPGKVQSCLMAGVPILGMLDGEGAKVIEDAQAGLTCAAGDSEGLARQVLRMADASVDQLKAWGVNGRRYASREFGRQQLMDQLEGLLEEAVQIYCAREKRESRVET